MIGAQVQADIYAALNGATDCGARVYDRVPEAVVFPYLTIGDEQVIDDSDQCGDAWDVSVDVHVWSRPVNGSKAEAKAIAAQVVVAIKSIVPVFMPSGGFSLDAVHHETTRTLRDADGKTEHSVITFRLVASAI